MGLFSKMSEDEILKRQIEQDERHQNLDRREADLARRVDGIIAEEKGITDRWETLKADVEGLARTRKELSEKERALDLREIEAAAGFVAQQQKNFDEFIGQRVRQLDDLQRALTSDAKKGQAEVESRMADCAAREQRLEQREAEAHERDKILGGREDAVRRREDAVRQAEVARDAGYARERGQVDVELHQKRQEVADKAEELRRREERIQSAEQELARGFTEREQQFALELHAKRRKIEEDLREQFDRGLAEVREKLNVERQQEKERLHREGEAEKARLRADRDVFQREHEAWVTDRNEQRKAVDQARAELEAKELELDFQRKRLDAKAARFEDRTQELDDEVEQAAAARKDSYQRQEETLKTEINRLREQLRSVEKLNGLFEGLKRQLGGRSAEQVVADLEVQQKALIDLREQVTQHSPVMRKEFDHLCAERDRLAALAEQKATELMALQKRMQGEDTLILQLEMATAQNKSLTVRIETLDASVNQLSEANKRLRSAYEREEDREARIRDIETPDLTEVARRSSTEVVDEIEWLNKIGEDCRQYGLRFHPRILRAFHTALKTAEFSPLTVLAGISGTGKSELPKHYAHFGGMTFLSLPVQPNWDSQESMLGFFNSIDNRFDAQPVLKLLARSQLPWSDQNHGLKDSIVVILLDEMNLAHPELYFAEFLSKLEQRRGSRDVPALEVKLGAGLIHYKLPLGRNVLWTGTMNQDETTKSLSDKVLDRSIVIHFPRPTNLERRRDLKPLPKAASLLPRKIWQSWWMQKSEFSDDEIRPFKVVIEDINEAMSKVGRALGHRVWQSVEYYMANYPDTLAAQRNKNEGDLRRAMRTAFEDQLIQKVMPKLRGIETRGTSRFECLDKVRAILAEHEYDILEDFDLSCGDFGHGQFIWQTVNFLREPVASEGARSVAVPSADPSGMNVSRAESAEAGNVSQDDAARSLAADGLPPTFHPDDPERAIKWQRLNPQKREKYLNPKKVAPR